MATHTRIIIIIIILISLIVCQNDYVCKRKNTLVSSRQNSGLNPVHAQPMLIIELVFALWLFWLFGDLSDPMPFIASVPRASRVRPIQWISLSWYMLQPYTRRL